MTRFFTWSRRVAGGLLGALGLMWALAACTAAPAPTPTLAPTPTITVPPLPTRGPTATPAHGETSPVGPVVGRLAPDFTLPGLFDRHLYTLSQWRGTPVVVNFWATWCPPCIEELPMLADYADRYQGQVQFLAVNVDESPVKIQRFVREELGLADTALLFLLDPTSAVSLEYRVSGFPTTFFVDAQGVIRYIRIGGMVEDDVRAGLNRILEPAP